MTRTPRAHRTRSTFRPGRGTDPYLGVLRFRAPLQQQRARSFAVSRLGRAA